MNFETILLALHIFIILSLFALILMQKNSSDGLAGLAGGGHNFISAKAVANALSKITMFFVFLFIINSIAIAKLHINSANAANKLIDQIEKKGELTESEKKLRQSVPTID